MKLKGLFAYTLVAFAAVAQGRQYFFATNEGEKIWNQLDLAAKKVFDKAGDVRDDVFKSWNDAQVAAWAKAHDLYDETYSADELRSIAEKNRQLLADDVRAYANKAQKTAEPYISKTKENVAQAASDLFDSTVAAWSESRLKAFLDARAIPVPQASKKDELVALVRRNKHKAVQQTQPSGSWWFDTWSTDAIAKQLKDLGAKAEGTREELVQRLYDAYSSAKASGQDAYNAASASADKVAQQSGEAWAKFRKESFEQWSDSDLRAYLESYGVVQPKDTHSQLVQKAKANYRWFTQGTTETPTERVINHAKAFGTYALSQAQTWSQAIYYHIHAHLNSLYAKFFESKAKKDL